MPFPERRRLSVDGVVSPDAQDSHDEQPFEDTGALNFWTPPRDETEDPRLQLRLLWDGSSTELVNFFGNRAGFYAERMATGEVEQDARAGIGTMDARQAWGALVAHATKWKEWSDGSDERYAEALVAVYLTAGRGLIPRRGDWLPGTAWDMSDLAPLSVAERCEPAPEDATFTHERWVTHFESHFRGVRSSPRTQARRPSQTMGNRSHP